MTVELHCGDCLEVMRGMASESVDAVVTDPPYGLRFMGKKWDYDVPTVDVWREVLRVLKPGGHLLSFGGTRTYHRMVVNIEDAGFEIRDMVQWLYGSGFPKSHDISKAIDREAGAEIKYQEYKRNGGGYNGKGKHIGQINTTSGIGMRPIATTPEAEKWNGWGTALKPACEPICLARKPIECTVAENVLEYGTGAINIDGCRIGTKPRLTGTKNPEASAGSGVSLMGSNGKRQIAYDLNPPSGRWPANVILDEDAARMLDEQSGERKAGGKVNGLEPSHTGQNGIYGNWGRIENKPFADHGGASRFFYVAKASRSERNAGLDGMEARRKDENRNENFNTIQSRLHGAVERVNNHPTVKPITLMRYLCRLITPPQGVILDPYMGSGSTGCAAVLEGFDFIGIEREAEYLEIARRRIAYWSAQQQMRLPMEGV